jgi:predicted Zn-dependent protease
VVAKFAFAAANIEFARAIGAARSGDTERARRAVDRLRALGDGLREPRFAFFARQVQMQTMAAAAWLAQSRGDSRSALDQMRKAAELEDLLGKHPVTPGGVLPARELLGEMLLEQHRPAEARVEFEASLRAFPARFTLLYGAGHAAALAGDVAAAHAHFTALQTLAGRGDRARPELAEARRFVEGPSAR